VLGATGCGPNGDGSLDTLVDLAAGLPSASGNNHLVLDDASNSLAPTKVFADDWHIGFGVGPTTTTTMMSSPSPAYIE
jgi:hypothetical protein